MTPTVAATTPSSAAAASAASAVSTFLGRGIPWAMIVDSRAITGSPRASARRTRGWTSSSRDHRLPSSSAFSTSRMAAGNTRAAAPARPLGPPGRRAAPAQASAPAARPAADPRRRCCRSRAPRASGRSSRHAPGHPPSRVCRRTPRRPRGTSRWAMRLLPQEPRHPLLPAPSRRHPPAQGARLLLVHRQAGTGPANPARAAGASPRTLPRTPPG